MRGAVLAEPADAGPTEKDGADSADAESTAKEGDENADGGSESIREG